jgi:outer membrane protein assembly factor BamB
MFPIRVSVFSAIFGSLLLPLCSSAQDAPPLTASTGQNKSRDWVTWGYDQERTGWNQGETALTKSNVQRLKLQWSTQLSTQPSDIVLSTLTAPVVVEGVDTAAGRKDLVFLLGADDTLFALDAGTGKVVWQKTFPNLLTPERPALWQCPNVANDTPVIDKQRGIIFFIASDGKLRGVDLSNGKERLPATDFIAPFSRAWSLNLINNVIYTANARSCGDVVDHSSAMAAATTLAPNITTNDGSLPQTIIEPGSVSAMDVSNLAQPLLTRFYTSGGRQSGPWGRGGVAKSPKGVVVQTADGLYDPATGAFGSSVLELAPKATRLADSFTPANWRSLTSHDLDFGSASPVVFPFLNRTLMADAGKEGVVYLLDTADLGGGPPAHSTPVYKSPQLGNDAALGTEPGQGVWGALATAEIEDGKRYLYVPMWGPPSKYAPTFKYSNGATPNGSIMAFEVVMDGNKISLSPQWTSPNMIVPDPPVVANGVVYAIQTGEQTIQTPIVPPGQPRLDRLRDRLAVAAFRAKPVSNLILYALDAETGKQLYSSKKIISNWTHFSEPVVALDKIFVVTHDAHVYAFGVGR